MLALHQTKIKGIDLGTKTGKEFKNPIYQKLILNKNTIFYWGRVKIRYIFLNGN